MSDSLHSILPEPIDLESQPVPGVPPSGPKPGTPFTSKVISFLSGVQKYSVIPFSIFSVLHLSAVILAPAISGPDMGNEVMDMGREIYQTPSTEPLIFASAAAHAISGILVTLIRKFITYRKYGKLKSHKTKEKLVKTNEEKENVKDVNEGLGGLGSMLGWGSKKSFTYRLFGISPLSFSGFIFMIMLTGHVLSMRLSPLTIDGDSSYIDLSFVSYTLSVKKLKMAMIYLTFTFVGSYHMVSGANRFLKLYSKKARKIAYAFIYSTAALAVISLVRIANMVPVPPSMAERFAKYLKH